MGYLVRCFRWHENRASRRNISTGQHHPVSKGAVVYRCLHDDREMVENTSGTSTVGIFIEVVRLAAPYVAFVSVVEFWPHEKASISDIYDDGTYHQEVSFIAMARLVPRQDTQCIVDLLNVYTSPWIGIRPRCGRSMRR